MAKIDHLARYVVTPGGEELAILPRTALEQLIEEAGHAKALAEHRAGRDPGLGTDEMRELLAAPTPLAFWRRKRRLSQVALATAAGLSQNYVSDLEAGKREGSAMQWLKIARALDVSMEELVTVEEPKPRATMRQGAGGMGRIEAVLKDGTVEPYDPKRHGRRRK